MNLLLSSLITGSIILWSSPKQWFKPLLSKRYKNKMRLPWGVGESYDEVKKKSALSLTPTAIKGLNELAEEFGISRSELVERIGRRIIKISKV